MSRTENQNIKSQKATKKYPDSTSTRIEVHCFGPKGPCPESIRRLLERSMHPLVRKLYKEALHVGRDYPLGLDKVRQEWKKAIRNPNNCPSCYNFVHVRNDDIDKRISRTEHLDDEAGTIAIPKRMHSREHPNPDCERELRKAVGRGKFMIREMIGVIQLKKYRTLRQRYDDSDGVAMLKEKLAKLEQTEGVQSFESRDDGPKKDA